MSRPPKHDRTTALLAATSLFWEKGYQATTLKELQTVLGMKPGSIYATFTGKDNLYQEAMACYFESNRKAFRTEIAQAPSPLDGLAAHLSGYMNLSTAHPHRQVCMLMKTFIETKTTHPDIAKLATDYLGEIRLEIAKVFQKAVDLGELPKDSNVHRLAQRYQSNLNALRFELYRGTPEPELSDLITDMRAEIRSL